MIPYSTAIVAFICVILSMVGYLFAARQGKKKEIHHPDDYFLARQRMTPDDYGDTQIAYALQMSTVYPFFVLTVSGAWTVPVLNSIFWFVGIFLFFFCVPSFKPFLGESRTIHAFIANLNEAPSLRRFASSLTIIAFVGVIIFEIVYGASVFKVIFGGNRIIYYLVIAFLAAYLTTYIWNGGQTATLRTEQFQLLIAYVGLHISVVYMIFDKNMHVNKITPSVVPLLVLIASLFMVCSRLKALWRAVKKRRRLITFAYVVILLSLSSMIVALTVSAPKFDYNALLSTDVSLRNISPINFWMMMGTAVLLPIFWQFVDLTNWQRICSLTTQSPDDYVVNAKRGLKEYFTESPLSWLIAVVLGLLAPQLMNVTQAGNDPFETFIRYFLGNGKLMPQIVGIFLVAGVVGIFMSTADAAITAVGYAFAYDFWKPSRELIDKQDPLSDTETQFVISAGRSFMAIAVVFIIVAFVLLDWFDLGSQFIGLLFAFYTPLISLSPAILCPVWFKRRPGGKKAFIAILAGVITGLGLGFFSILGYPQYQWYPAPSAFIVSWAFYLMFLCGDPQRVDLQAN